MITAGESEIGGAESSKRTFGQLSTIRQKTIKIIAFTLCFAGLACLLSTENTLDYPLLTHLLITKHQTIETILHHFSRSFLNKKSSIPSYGNITLSLMFTLSV